HQTGNQFTVRMITDKHDARLGTLRSFLLEIGLNPVAHRLNNKPMLFSCDCRKSFGPEYRLLQSNFADCCFESFCILRIVAMQNKRLPSCIVLMEMLMGVLSMLVGAKTGVRMA